MHEMKTRSPSHHWLAQGGYWPFLIVILLPVLSGCGTRSKANAVVRKRTKDANVALITLDTTRA